jgi:hypothetical protein
MLDSFPQFPDWFGLCVFALTGALVAFRKQMDIVGFALLGSVTGIVGGTIRISRYWVSHSLNAMRVDILNSATGLAGQFLL